MEEAIGDNYAEMIQYLDSKRDRDTLKAVLTKVTSVKFMTKLANIQDKRSFQRSKDQVGQNLVLFKDMKREFMSDLDEASDPQRKKKKCLLECTKLEKLRHIFKGRGRRLKCEEFPDLAGILEFAFGEGDRVDRAGGGLESHPRLTDTVLYRATDSNTIMRQARETILALAPEGFNISLSSCFNYTQNYREWTYQARRHHSGRGINACLSLHKPPRTGVEQFVINLHWSMQNVNLTLDLSHLYPDNIMVDSKDEKAKIHSDVSPVTPMTHLFLKTETILEDEEDNDVFSSLRRTGTAATLLNLSYFEPETIGGGNPCVVLRGIGGDESFVFQDEEKLVTFLGKSELQKDEDDSQYEPIKNKLWSEVATVWNLDENFVGSYRDDYQIIQNSYHE